MYPRGGAEDVDEQEVRGEDGREVFDALVRGGRDLAEDRKVIPNRIAKLWLQGGDSSGLRLTTT